MKYNKINCDLGEGVRYMAFAKSIPVGTYIPAQDIMQHIKYYETYQDMITGVGTAALNEKFINSIPCDALIDAEHTQYMVEKYKHVGVTYADALKAELDIEDEDGALKYIETCINDNLGIESQGANLDQNSDANRDTIGDDHILPEFYD